MVLPTVIIPQWFASREEVSVKFTIHQQPFFSYGMQSLARGVSTRTGL
jgi:hypothetical protein